MTAAQDKRENTHLWLRGTLGDYARCRSPIARIPAELDALALQRWVTAHGLEGLFYQAEDEGGRLDAVLPQWRQKAMARLLANLRALRASSHLFTLLDAAGIEAAAMRGVVLAHRDYASPEERGMRDVDVLLHPASRTAVLELLQRAGHTPIERLRSQDVMQIEGVVMELHWSLLTAKRYRGCVDAAQWLRSRRPLESREGRLYTLSAEYELIGLILHAFIHHEMSIFKQLLDIALFMTRKDLNWEQVAGWCRRARVHRMFALSLHLVDTLFFLRAEAYRSHFALPASCAERVQAWIAPFFGRPALGDYLQRKANMLYAAETPARAFRQGIGFFSAAEFRDLRKRYQSRN